MKKLKYQEIEGDLIEMAKEGKFQFIVHGCNCFQVMEAGIAYTIAQAFPEVLMVDQASTRSNLQRLGDFTYVTIPTASTFINLYSQYYTGSSLDYEALTLGLRKINKTFGSDELSPSIGLPLIGCGIAGGDWKRVKKIIQKELKDMNVTIVHYKK